MSANACYVRISRKSAGFYDHDVMGQRLAGYHSDDFNSYLLNK